MCESTKWLSRYEGGTYTYEIPIREDALNKLVNASHDKSLKRMIASWATVPTFHIEDIISMDLQEAPPEDQGDVANIIAYMVTEVRRGGRVLSTFVKFHENPQASWASLEPDILELWCKKCGEEHQLERRSLEEAWR